MSRKESLKSYPLGNVLNICLIKHKEPTSPCNNGGTIHQKNLYYSFSWREPPFIGLLAIYKFNTYNEYLTWISSKLNVKDITISNTNELYDKRSTENSEVSFG